MCSNFVWWTIKRWWLIMIYPYIKIFFCAPSWKSPNELTGHEENNRQSLFLLKDFLVMSRELWHTASSCFISLTGFGRKFGTHWLKKNIISCQFFPRNKSTPFVELLLRYQNDQFHDSGQLSVKDKTIQFCRQNDTIFAKWKCLKSDTEGLHASSYPQMFQVGITSERKANITTDEMCLNDPCNISIGEKMRFGFWASFTRTCEGRHPDDEQVFFFSVRFNFAIDGRCYRWGRRQRLKNRAKLLVIPDIEINYSTLPFFFLFARFYGLSEMILM